MTIVVVDPADIREDAEQALRGVERLKGKRFEELVTEVFNSHDNQRFTWFGLRKPALIYDRRTIATLLAEMLIDRNRGGNYKNYIADWWSVEGVFAAWHGYNHFKVKPVERLIASAESLNAIELHVDSNVLRQFEAAYEAGSRHSTPEE